MFSLFHLFAYLIFVIGTTGSAGVKIFSPVSTKCELVCLGVKILNLVLTNLELVCFWYQLKMVPVSTK